LTRTPAHIENLIAPSLNAMGYDVVRVLLLSGRQPTLQILAEPESGAPMTVQDCTTVSRHVSAVLDVADPIAGGYLLEVSSPGVGRPLRSPADFCRFAGREARIETRDPIEGRRRFRGHLEGLDGSAVRIRIDDGGEAKVVPVPLDAIAAARLELPEDVRTGRGRRAGEGRQP
jgi:ribosome maturation factor RimP